MKTEDLDERLLESLLEEIHQQLESPDVTESVAEQLAVAPTPDIANTRWRRALLPVAAAALIGLIAVAVATMGDSDAIAPTVPSRQDVVPDEPRSLEDFLTRLDGAAAATIHVHRVTMQIAIGQGETTFELADETAGILELTRGDLDAVVTALRTAARGKLRPRVRQEGDTRLELKSKAGKVTVIWLRQDNDAWAAVSGQEWTTGGSMLAQVTQSLQLRSVTAASRELGIIPSSIELDRQLIQNYSRDLEELRLFNMGAMDLERLDYFRAVKRLHLSGSAGTLDRRAFHAEGWPDAQRTTLQGLEELVARGVRIDDEGVRQLATLPNLSYLNLSDANVRTEIQLEDTPSRGPLTGVGFAAFAKAGKLREVRLAGARGLTGAGIAAVAALPRLQVLDLSGLEHTELAPIDLAGLRRAIDLRELRIGWRQRSSFPPAFRTDEITRYIDGLPNLQELDLSQSTLRRQGLAEIRALPSLIALDLSDCPHLSGDEAALLATRFRSLRRIDLSGISPVQAKPLEALTALPSLERLTLRHASFTDTERARLLHLFGARVTFLRP